MKPSSLARSFAGNAPGARYAVSRRREPFQISIRGGGDEQCVVDVSVDGEFGVGYEECLYRRVRFAAGAPGPVGEKALGHVFDDRIKDDAITPGRDERGVGSSSASQMRCGTGKVFRNPRVAPFVCRVTAGYIQSTGSEEFKEVAFSTPDLHEALAADVPLDDGGSVEQMLAKYSRTLLLV